MTLRCVIVAAIVLAASAAPTAQRGPSFDCAKATSSVERMICGDSTLATSDREMAAVYTVLVTTLSGAAKAHLVSDQARWIRERDRDCASGSEDAHGCLELRYRRRTQNLREFGGDSYPFVGTWSIYETGRAGNSGTYSIDIRYPQFDGASADFSLVNRRLSDEARVFAEQATGSAGVPMVGSYVQGFALYRPSANAIGLAIDHISTGGAHGNSGSVCALIDLRAGKAVGPEEVFVPGDAWLATMIQIIRADLKGEAADDALDPDSLARLLRDSQHYCYKSDRLQLVFNRYALRAPSAGGREFRIDVPYARVKPLLRVDGPLGIR